MPVRPRFETPLENQRVHGFQSLLKSARQTFHPNFRLSQDKLSQKTSLLVRFEILALFGNTLTAAHMYFRDMFKRHYLKIPQHSLHFLLQFCNVHKI